MNADFIMAFLEERWFVIAGALVVLFLVVRLVKTVIKWVIILAILAGLYYYGASYKDQLMELGTSFGATVGAKVTEEVKNRAVQTVTEEIKEAKYTSNADGSFTVSTRSAKLQGRPGSTDVQVTFLNQTFNLKADAAIQAVIEQARRNAGL